MDYKEIWLRKTSRMTSRRKLWWYRRWQCKKASTLLARVSGDFSLRTQSYKFYSMYKLKDFCSNLPPCLVPLSPDDITELVFLLLVLKSVQQLMELSRDWNLSILSCFWVCLCLLSSIVFGQVGGVAFWFRDVLDDFSNLTLKPLSSSISGLKDFLRWNSWSSDAAAILKLNVEYCSGFSKTSLCLEIERCLLERCLLHLLVKDENQLLRKWNKTKYFRLRL